MKKIILICLCLLVGISGYSAEGNKAKIRNCAEKKMPLALVEVWEQALFSVEMTDNERSSIQAMINDLKLAIIDGNEKEVEEKIDRWDETIQQEIPSLHKRLQETGLQTLSNDPEQLVNLFFAPFDSCIDQTNLSPVEKETTRLSLCTDGLVLEDLNEQVIEKVRKKFVPTIALDEDILYVSNEPGWWLTDTAAVITNKKLYRYEKAPIALEQFWDSTYSDGHIYLGNNNHISLNDLKENWEPFTDEDISYMGERIYQSFRRMAYASNPSLQDTFWKDFQNTPKNKREAFLEKNCDKRNWQCYHALSLTDYDKYQNAKDEHKKEEYRKDAAEELKKAISLLKITPVKSETVYPLIDLALELKEYAMARELAVKYDETIRQEYKKKAEKEFVEHFFELPYNERKLIVLADAIPFLNANATIIPVNIHELPKNISFSSGQPSVGEVYIAHPYTKEYILLESGYEWRLLTEQIREFCEVMDKIGAKQCLAGNVVFLSKGQQNDSTLALQGAVHGEQKTAGVAVGGKIEGSYNKEESVKREQLQERLNSISQNFTPPYTFQFTGEEDWLVWYPHKKDWRHLVRQVKEGSNLEEHIATFSSRDLHKLQQMDCKEMQAELEGYADAKLLGRKVGIEAFYKRCNDSKLEEEKDVSVQFKVTFPPSAAGK
ncbi:MAG: hypothetical protein ACI351_01505 [Candidatus Avelusimicrobium sp.]|uniref:hypothetical protein n=1 Tax=Candidatus Avelusimicrobium sp. TaxID=3048833 RepID=UPI003EFBCCEF